MALKQHEQNVMNGDERVMRVIKEHGPLLNVARENSLVTCLKDWLGTPSDTLVTVGSGGAYSQSVNSNMFSNFSELTSIF